MILIYDISFCLICSPLQFGRIALKGWEATKLYIQQRQMYFRIWIYQHDVKRSNSLSTYTTCASQLLVSPTINQFVGHSSCGNVGHRTPCTENSILRVAESVYSWGVKTLRRKFNSSGRRNRLFVGRENPALKIQLFGLPKAFIRGA